MAVDNNFPVYKIALFRNLFNWFLLLLWATAFTFYGSWATLCIYSNKQ